MPAAVPLNLDQVASTLAYLVELTRVRVNDEARASALVYDFWRFEQVLERGMLQPGDAEAASRDLVSLVKGAIRRDPGLANLYAKVRQAVGGSR